MEPSPRDYYAVLDVSPTATLQDIRKRYHELVLQVHPDKNPQDDNASRKFQTVRISEVGGVLPGLMSISPYTDSDILQVFEAYKPLSDPSKRAVYDFGYRRRRNARGKTHQESSRPQPKPENKAGGRLPKDAISGILLARELEQLYQRREGQQTPLEVLNKSILETTSAIEILRQESLKDEEGEKAANPGSAESTEANKHRERQRSERTRWFRIYMDRLDVQQAILDKEIGRLDTINREILVTEGKLQATIEALRR